MEALAPVQQCICNSKQFENPTRFADMSEKTQTYHFLAAAAAAAAAAVAPKPA